MSEPGISVIVPVYNGAAYLGEALQSVLAQELTPLEILVVDDGSSDNSVQLAHSFEGVTVLVEPHRGVSAARNAGVSASRGEWLAFLDADDTWQPRKLLLQAAVSKPVDMVFCHYTARFEGGVPAWYRGPAAGLNSPCLYPSAWLVRRTLFDRAGPFDSTWTHGEDMEWMSRALQAGATHEWVRSVLVTRRIHASNASEMTDDRKLILELARAHRRRAQAQVP